MELDLRGRAGSRIEAFINVYRDLSRLSGESVLSRRNMTMRAVLDFAPDMTIVELVSDDEWIVRLNGTGHCDHARKDRTGQNALETCSAAERALRLRLAESMFGTPCGLRAQLAETFENGAEAMLDTTSLPLLGNQGERMIVTYGLLIEDIPEPYQDRPVLSSIAIAEHRFVDLGQGIAAG